MSGRIRLDSSVAAAPWNCRPTEPAMVLRCDSVSGGAVLCRPGEVVRRWDNPLAALEWMPRYLEELAETARKTGSSRDAGAAGAAKDDQGAGQTAGVGGGASDQPRWIGYFNYDLGRLFERLPEQAADDLRMPLFAFTLHGPAIQGNWPQSRFVLRSRGAARSNFTREAYLAAVGRALDYIAAGDVFQVNLAQRFTAPLSESPSVIYQRLQRQSPARYGAYLDHGDYALLCNSPELFLQVRSGDGHRTVITRPIKGTRPLGAGMADQLRDSIKDQAELNMIIDLERNDLGRVCEIGSVRVIDDRAVESHPTVYHAAATIQGRLRADVGFVDLLRSTFPGGSITGAPKIRAMEIIEQLEPVRRGPYCGAIGYLAPGGEMEFNIAIRTMIVRDGEVHLSAGGGIVADSDPAQEYEETVVKTRALFAALGCAPADLRSM